MQIVFQWFWEIVWSLYMYSHWFHIYVLILMVSLLCTTKVYSEFPWNSMLFIWLFKVLIFHGDVNPWINNIERLKKVKSSARWLSLPATDNLDSDGKFNHSIAGRSNRKRTVRCPLALVPSARIVHSYKQIDLLLRFNSIDGFATYTIHMMTAEYIFIDIDFHVTF